MEGRERHLRAELFLVGIFRELEESQRAAVSEAEEAMRIGAFRSEEKVLLAPGGEQRQPDDLFVKLSSRLEVARDIGGVVQARGQFCFRGGLRRHDYLLRFRSCR